MDASRITFTEAVQGYKFDKTKHREKLMLDLIKSKPNGSVIGKAEILDKLGMSHKSSGEPYRFLERMEKKGLIYRDKINSNRTAYYATDGVSTVVQPEVRTVKPRKSYKKRVTKAATERRKAKTLSYIARHNGEVINNRTLSEVMGKTPNNVWAFMKILEKEGKVRLEKTYHGNAYYLTNNEQLEPSQAFATGSEPEPETKNAPQNNEPVFDISKIYREHAEALAKDFHWECNSDSLHEFVKWLNEGSNNANN